MTTAPSTVCDVARRVRSGGCSAEETIRTALDRIRSSQTMLNAFIEIQEDRALTRARALDAAFARGEAPGPLAGVPIAVKDNMCMAHGATTCASRILSPFRAVYNAHVVDRLEQAGAIIVGKTNLDEFAMGSSTEHAAHGPTRNPWNLSRVPGGSSGGSAAAVAARLVPAALGSDTGGSIRQPASFCGIAGLKPTYGRVSRYGLVAFASSLDQIGPFAGSVQDIALLLSAIAGHDERDSTSVDAPVPDYAAGLDRPLEGLRIGMAKEYFGEGLNPEVRAAIEAAVQLLADQGARIVPIELPHTRYGVACYYIIAPAEASSNLARYDGVHYGHRTAHPADLIDLYAASRGEGFGPEVKRRIMLGTYVLSSGYYDAYYLKALKVRTLLKQDFDRAFEKVEVIASPVAPTTAFALGAKTDDPLEMYLNDIYTISANLAGICGLSLPCGFDRQGLPIGLQLMGKPFDEQTLLAVGHQYQLLTSHHTRVPAAFATSGAAG